MQGFWACWYLPSRSMPQNRARDVQAAKLDATNLAWWLVRSLNWSAFGRTPMGLGGGEDMASALRGRVGRQGAVAGLVFMGLLFGVLPSVTGADAGEYLGSFGPDGTTSTEFAAPGALAVDQETGTVYLIDLHEQVLYKFDSAGNPLDYEGSASYLTGNEITGLEIS